MQSFLRKKCLKKNMAFLSKTDNCRYLIIRHLKQESSTYNKLFKKVKMSHTTLQKALEKLTENSLIEKNNNKIYSITKKGEEINHLLLKINNLINQN